MGCQSTGVPSVVSDNWPTKQARFINRTWTSGGHGIAMQARAGGPFEPVHFFGIHMSGALKARTGAASAPSTFFFLALLGAIAVRRQGSQQSCGQPARIPPDMHGQRSMHASVHPEFRVHPGCPVRTPGIFENPGSARGPVTETTSQTVGRCSKLPILGAGGPNGTARRGRPHLSTLTSIGNDIKTLPPGPRTFTKRAAGVRILGGDTEPPQAPA